MQLRYYQEEAVASIYTYFAAEHGNPILALPTGTGKSVIIGEFIRGIYAAYPTQRVMMLTHVKELIQQNLEKLLTLWPTAPAGVYSAGIGRKETSAPITFAGIASVAKRASSFGHIDLVLIDECHLVSPSSSTMYATFLSELRKVNPYLKVIGLSATPYRLGLGALTGGKIFTSVCFDLTTLESFNRLIDEGFLAPLIPKKTSTEYDMAGVATRGGEFVQDQMQAAVDVAGLTQNAVQEVIKNGNDRAHWLIFASGISHANHVRDALDAFGVSVCSVHSEMSSEERDEAIRGFKSGKYRAVVNNNVLTTGFDFPEIDLIAVMRPTKSTGLWVQMLGRGTRPAAGKTNCLVLDFAGNTRRLGPINDPVMPKAKGNGGGEAPIKLCPVPGCETYNHAAARFCCGCNFEFPKNVVSLASSASEEELIRREKKDDGRPVVEPFKVDRVVYREHQKAGRPPTMQVDYYCGLRVFKEWVCLEHLGYPAQKAKRWWKEHSRGDEAPSSTEEALRRMGDLIPPTQIRVWLNKQYPEILGADYV